MAVGVGSGPLAAIVGPPPVMSPTRNGCLLISDASGGCKGIESKVTPCGQMPWGDEEGRGGEGHRRRRRETWRRGGKLWAELARRSPEVEGFGPRSCGGNAISGSRPWGFSIRFRLQALCPSAPVCPLFGFISAARHRESHLPDTAVGIRSWPDAWSDLAAPTDGQRRGGPPFAAPARSIYRRYSDLSPLGPIRDRLRKPNRFPAVEAPERLLWAILLLMARLWGSARSGSARRRGQSPMGRGDLWRRPLPLQASDRWQSGRVGAGGRTTCVR